MTNVLWLVGIFFFFAHVFYCKFFCVERDLATTRRQMLCQGLNGCEKPLKGLTHVLIHIDTVKFQLVDFCKFLRLLYRIVPQSFSSSERNLLGMRIIEDRLFDSVLNTAGADIVQGKAYPRR